MSPAGLGGRLASHFGSHPGLPHQP